MHRGHRDATQALIVQTLRDVGASVFDAADVGGGFPDLVVGFRGVTHLLECKIPKGKLRPSQEKFQQKWRGAPFVVVRSPADALRAIGLPDSAAVLETSCLRAALPAGVPRTS
jgi:hypothetical protein